MFQKNIKYQKLRESPSPPPPLPERNVVQKPPDRPPKPQEKNLIDLSSNNKK